MNQPHRLLFIHRGALGDFILALHLMDAVRRAGDRRVDCLGRVEYAPIAKRAGIDSFLDIETGGWHNLYKSEIPSDAMIQSLSATDLICAMIGRNDANVRFVETLSRAANCRAVIIDPRLRESEQKHITEQWRGDLMAEGIAVEEIRPLDLRTNHGRNSKIVFHPGSGGRLKCWPIENFVHLARQMQVHGARCECLIGPVEEEIFSDDEIRQLESTMPARLGMSLDHCAEYIGSSRVFIGNDSGVTHLAAALDVPTLAVFGATDPVHWRPLGREVHVIGGKEFPSVEEVMKVVNRIGSGYSQPTRQ